MNGIGLLGWPSWESSAEYYRLVTDTTRLHAERAVELALEP